MGCSARSAFFTGVIVAQRGQAAEPVIIINNTMSIYTQTVLPVKADIQPVEAGMGKGS